MKKHYYFLKGFLTLILFSITFFLYAQYPAVTHSASPCRDATISTVIIEDANSNELYRKLDFCSGTAAKNYRTLFGTECSPVTSLKPGETYILKVNCTSLGWDDDNAGVGIWADFNDDKDFADAGEMLSDITWNDRGNTPGATGVINRINGTRPGTTRSLTFTVPSYAASSFVIRIRSTDFGATMTQASAGGNQIDGETEDSQ